MKTMKRMLALFTAVIIALSLAACNSGQSNFPNKAVEVIIPWTAGSGTDVAGRLYLSYMEKPLGQTMNVLNVPGSSGAVGLMQAKTAAADGYTMALLNFDVLSVEVLGLAELSYKDFELIGTFSIQPTVYVTMADREWKNTQDYIDYAKANPGSLMVATNGDGAVWHQAGAVANRAMDIDVTYVPYNGGSEEVAALLGGHVDAIIVSYNTVMDYLIDGTMMAIGVMTEERIEAINDAPTFKEQGYDVIYNSWRGLAVPKGTPEAVVKKLREAAKTAFDNPEFQEAAKKAGIDTWYLNGDEFANFLKESLEDADSILKALGLA